MWLICVYLLTQNQLGKLVDMLTATDPFYIRCMKPNIHKKPNQFDVNLMATQLVLDIIDERRLTHFSLLAVLWDAGDHQSEESWVLCTAQI